MSSFMQKSFSVSMRGADPATCRHDMTRVQRGQCVCSLCGEPLVRLGDYFEPALKAFARLAEARADVVDLLGDDLKDRDDEPEFYKLLREMYVEIPEDSFNAP